MRFRGHAILSHRSAAFVWGLLGQPPDGATLTIVSKQARSSSGLRVHRVKDLDRCDLRVRHGLPLTAPARTALDLAAEASDAELEEAVSAGFIRGLVRPEEIWAAMKRAPGRRGLVRLKRLLTTGEASGFTRSKAERRLRSLLRAAELPQPRSNVPMMGYVADFVWLDHKLIVEVDAYLFHSHRSSFEHDRRRDQVFAAAGYVVVRVTWRQLCDEPLAVVARIAQAVVRRAA
jgi:very-short-patch-repair endonuclease